MCVKYVNKNFQIQILIEWLLTIHEIFTKKSQILHTHKNHNFKSIIRKRDQLILPYISYGILWQRHAEIFNFWLL